ncbi:MAG: hypothetical protein QNK37_18265 [Acidobacteriota bacterium]|nr:hypothetical protein [Acidobacteriota bacterium]
MLLILLCIVASGKVPQFSKPQPVAPDGGIVQDSVVQFRTQNWVCQLRSVSADDLRGKLQEKGISAELLNDKRLKNFFDRAASFEIAFRNLGEDPISFNPEQVNLIADGTVDGFMVRTWDFIPVGAGQVDPELQKLADIFSPSSFQVAPGRVGSQLLVFKPARNRFFKRVALVVNHLYSGSESTRIECRFDVRYRKP